MYCSNCGNSLEAASKFCSNCGTPAVNNSAPETAQPTCNFVVTGEIVEGQTLDAVKDNLEKHIKLERKTLDVIFTKKNVVLKKDIDKRTAEKYKKAFTKCGAICEITDSVTNLLDNDGNSVPHTQPHQTNEKSSEAKDSGDHFESPTDKEDHSKIGLWNPNAAASWSILFTPIFGAYLHSKNWAALGNKEKEKQSMYWAYGAIGMFIFSLFLPGTLGQGISIGYLLSWYFSIAKKQVKHVKEELDDSYEKNNWLKPIGVASSCLFALIIVFSIAASNQGYSAKVASAQAQTPQETKSISAQVNSKIVGNWECMGVDYNGETYYYDASYSSSGRYVGYGGEQYTYEVDGDELIVFTEHGKNISRITRLTNNTLHTRYDKLGRNMGSKCEKA